MTRGSDALTPEEVVVTLLRETNMTLSTAESCTGGAIAARIVNVPGASEVFMEGMVTYSNGAKKRTLGVTEDTLRDFGAVSEQCAKEMAEGGCLHAGTDACVSVTTRDLVWEAVLRKSLWARYSWDVPSEEGQRAGMSFYRKTEPRSGNRP